MTWTRLSDGWNRSLKFLGMKRDVRLFWVDCLTWCNEQLTDGFIPVDALMTISPDNPPRDRVRSWVDLLVIRGLFDPSITPDGWQIHDFLDCNHSRDQVLARRAHDAGKKARIRSKVPDVPRGTPPGTRRGTPQGTPWVEVPWDCPGPVPSRPVPSEIQRREEPPIVPRSEPDSKCHTVCDEPTGFGLTPPKPKRVKAAKEPTRPGYADVVKVWFEEFRACKGVDPVFSGKDGRHVNALIDACHGDHERVCSMIRNAFGDDWWAKNKASLFDILSNPNKFLVGPSNESPYREIKGPSIPVTASRIIEEAPSEAKPILGEFFGIGAEANA